MIHQTPQFALYFGNAQDSVNKLWDCIPTEQPLVLHKQFASVAGKIGADHLAFLYQTHGIAGMVVTDRIPAFAPEGDFLITAQKKVGIGVMTADCLPILFYDTKNHVAAIAHAGWRGTVAGIGPETVKHMQINFDTRAEDLQIFFGPSAKICCYEVGDDFKKMLPNYADLVLHNRENKTYFDVPRLNALLLQEVGIVPSQISLAYNQCTICDHQFCSHRRQPDAAGRQMSIILLRDA